MFKWGGKTWVKPFASGRTDLFELDDNPVISVTGKQVADANVMNVIDRPHGEDWYYKWNGSISTEAEKNLTTEHFGQTIPSNKKVWHDYLEKFFLTARGETGFGFPILSKSEDKRMREWNPKIHPDSLLQNFADGGYVNPAYAANLSVPKFEKGINMVPANMLAMLHKNEAVVPANMNPFNPNAQSYSQPSISYNISPVINAAPGMDEQAIANMATRQVLAEIKVLDARNNASMGRPGTRVVGK